MHLSVIADQPASGTAFVTVVAFAVLFQMGWRKRLLVLAGVVLAAASIIGLNNIHVLLYLPPFIVNALLLYLFGKTLLPGNTPLVMAMATKIRGELPPRVANYTRGVTALWTAFFFIILVEMLLLAAFAPFELWSSFAYAFNYLFTVTLFLAEYLYRRYRLRDIPHPRFIDYLQRVRRMDLRSVVDQ